jgi:hypothetical protein
MVAPMKGLILHLLRPLAESLRDLAPIIVVIGFFQLAVLGQPLPDLRNLLWGTVLVVVGLSLFIQGLKLGLFPLGETMAWDFTRKGSLPWLLLFAFALGFTAAAAEPALIAVTAKAAEVAAAGDLIERSPTARDAYAQGLRYTIALSVGIALVVGVLRILRGWPLHYLVIAAYLGVMVMTAVAPPEIIGLAYDAGGVTTSTITVPLVAAIGVGLASSIEGRNPLTDGFGMIALAALAPIIFVLAYGTLR